MTSGVYIARISVRYVSLFVTALGTGCSTTVYVKDLPIRALKPQTKPACTKADVEKIGEEECNDRKRTLITQSIASTVRINAFWYDKEKGEQQHVGTGVIIEDEGTILTSNHVIVDADFIIATILRIRTFDEKLIVADHWQFPVEVAYSGFERDVAILTPIHAPDSELLRPMKLRVGLVPIVGEEVMHFGQTTKTSTGETDKWPVKVDKISPLVSMKGIAKKGDSGGPVVALDGRLIGIVIAHNEPILKEDGNVRRTYFMPIDYAIDALRPWFLKTSVREVPVEDN